MTATMIDSDFSNQKYLERTNCDQSHYKYCITVIPGRWGLHEISHMIVEQFQKQKRRVKVPPMKIRACNVQTCNFST